MCEGVWTTPLRPEDQLTLMFPCWCWRFFFLQDYLAGIHNFFSWTANRQSVSVWPLRSAGIFLSNILRVQTCSQTKVKRDIKQVVKLAGWNTVMIHQGKFCWNLICQSCSPKRLSLSKFFSLPLDHLLVLNSSCLSPGVCRRGHVWGISRRTLVALAASCCPQLPGSCLGKGGAAALVTKEGWKCQCGSWVDQVSLFGLLLSTAKQGKMCQHHVIFNQRTLLWFSFLLKVEEH